MEVFGSFQTYGERQDTRICVSYIKIQHIKTNNPAFGRKSLRSEERSPAPRPRRDSRQWELLLLLLLHLVTLCLRCDTLRPQSVDHLPAAWPRIAAWACSYESAAAVVVVVEVAAVHNCCVVAAVATAAACTKMAIERRNLRQSAVRR